MAIYMNSDGFWVNTEKKEEEPAAKAEEPKTVEAAEVPAAKEEQKEEKPSYDPEIK